MERAAKIISKYYRLRYSDGIRKVVEGLPIKNLEETQVGNFVYSGVGEILVGSSHFPATVRIRLEDGVPTVSVTAPGAGISVACPFDAEAIRRAVKEAILATMN